MRSTEHDPRDSNPTQLSLRPSLRSAFDFDFNFKHRMTSIAPRLTVRGSTSTEAGAGDTQRESWEGPAPGCTTSLEADALPCSQMPSLSQRSLAQLKRALESAASRAHWELSDRCHSTFSPRCARSSLASGSKPSKLAQICIHVDHKTLYALLSTTKAFRATLQSATAKHIWDSARAEAGLPKLAAQELSDLQYAHLVWGKGCQVSS